MGKLNVTFYNSNQQDSLIVGYQWNSSNSSWRLYSELSTRYFNTGPNSFKESVFCFRDTLSNSWDSVYKSISSLYPVTLETEYYAYATSYPSGISYWWQTTKSDISFNDKGLIDTVLSYKLDLNTLIWDTSSYALYEYDEFNRIIYQTNFYNYSVTIHDFTFGQKVYKEYYGGGESFLIESYSYKSTTKEWKGEAKWYYYKGNPTVYAYYKWESISKDWIGFHKNELYTNEYNHIVKLKEFNGNTNTVDWVLDKITYYYYSDNYPAFKPNKAPTIDAIANQSIKKETVSINLSGITDGDGNTQTITLKAQSSNEDIATVNLIYSGGNSGTLEITGVSAGTATITITVKDNGGTENGGIDSYHLSFTIEVQTSSSFELSSTQIATLYPNPAFDFIQLAGNNIAYVQIISTSGTALLSTTDCGRIDISGLPAGTYFLKIHYINQEQQIVHFIKE